MELENITTIHSSEKSEIILGESEGKQYIKKTGEVSHEAVQKIAQINSPYIAKICELGENYIITEYAEGFPLSERKIPVKKVFEVALELCDALSVLHEQNIIHRDVKPSNIILCNDGHIKLIDFDAARIKKTTTDKDTRFVGTDGFAPPEQYGFMQTDERSDIYSFGVTIKLLLAENYARSPYKRVIERCIRFNPEQRYFSIKAVKSALKRSRIMPFVIGSIAGTAVLAAMILVLNFGINSQTPPDDMSRTESPFVQSTSSVSESSAPVYVSSSSSTNSSVSSSSSTSSGASSSSSTSLSTSSSSSTSSSTSSLSSTSSSVSNSNSTSSSTPSSSITSSSSSSSNSSSSNTSSSSSTGNTSIPVLPPDESLNEPIQTAITYPISWDIITVPEGLPRLTNTVSYCGFSKTTSKLDKRFLIKWENMSKEEMDKIIQKTYQWVGSDSIFTSFTLSNGDPISQIESSKFHIVISREKESPNSVFFNIYPKAANYVLPPINLDLADPDVTEGSSRSLKWEDTILPDYLPKLTDNITWVSYRNGSCEIVWDVMSLEETEAVIKKIVDAFDSGIKYELDYMANVYIWTLIGEIDGRTTNITINHITKYNKDYEKMDQTRVTIS